MPRQTAAAHQFSFAGRPRESRWKSFALSIALTLALFVAAVTSMRRVPLWMSSKFTDREVPVTVRFQSPPPVSVRRPPPQLRRAPPPTSTPSTVAPPGTPLPVAPAVTPQVGPKLAAPPTTIDTAAAGAKPPSALPKNDAPAVRLGAPVAPAGVSRIITTPYLQAQRNATADSVRAAAFAAQWNGITSDAVRQMAGASQSVAVATERRATTAGNGADVHVMHGDGINGVGAVGGSGLSLGSGSIGLPFLSKGPSAKQRRKNDSVDADNRARLARLQELIKHRRDSLLADSLRRDSLARLRRP
jgi:hypothetical protein